MTKVDTHAPYLCTVQISKETMLFVSDEVRPYLKRSSGPLGNAPEHMFYRHLTFQYMGTFKKKLGDILLLVSWREISRRYFGKPSSWIYGKIDGTDNGEPGSSFTEEELAVLKESFLDISERFKKLAEEL